MLLVSCRCDGRRTLKVTFGVIVANISKVFCDRGRIIWYVGSSEMLIALLQTTRRHISKQHNHLLTVLCEGTEEDVGLPERERERCAVIVLESCYRLYKPARRAVINKLYCAFD